jgi:putative transposase
MSICYEEVAYSMKRWRQQELKFRTRGGLRPGAGRKRVRLRKGVPHRARPEHGKAHPVHVTMRAMRGLPGLRKQAVFREMKRALSRTARVWFRIVHFSVQVDHVHLLVEADDKNALSRGLIGLTTRLARAINRVLVRKGRVWDDRFHAHELRSPREVRNGIVYVLMNAKKHIPNAPSVDPCSSARSFTGWRDPPLLGPPVPMEEQVTQPHNLAPSDRMEETRLDRARRKTTHRAVTKLRQRRTVGIGAVVTGTARHRDGGPWLAGGCPRCTVRGVRLSVGRSPARIQTPIQLSKISAECRAAGVLSFRRGTPRFASLRRTSSECWPGDRDRASGTPRPSGRT